MRETLLSRGRWGLCTPLFMQPQPWTLEEGRVRPSSRGMERQGELCTPDAARHLPNHVRRYIDPESRMVREPDGRTLQFAATQRHFRGDGQLGLYDTLTTPAILCMDLVVVSAFATATTKRVWSCVRHRSWRGSVSPAAQPGR